MKTLFTLTLTFLSLSAFTQTWQSIGPEGGYFKEFTFHPSDPNTIYAGSDDGGGVWKSTDGGDSWALLTADYPNMTGWSITFDDSLPDVIYACDLYGRYGVLKSTDQGDSWTPANNGLSSTYDKMVTGLVVKTSDTLFISTGESHTSTPPRPGNGIFKSYDAGTTWVPAGLQGNPYPCIGINEFGTIFAGSHGTGLYYTNDNGDSWLNHPDIPLIAQVNEIETVGNLILVACSEGIYLSSDWGITFTNIGLAGEFNFDACFHQTSPNIEIYSSTLNGLMHYSSVSGMWNQVPGAYFNDQVIIGIASNETDVYVSGFSNSPIFKSEDGGSNWSATTTSPNATEVNAIYVDPSNEDRIFAALMGSYNLNGDYDREAIYTTTDGGVNWTRKGPDAHGLCLASNPLDPNTFYFGSFAQGVYKTTDGFNTFTQLSPDSVTVISAIVSSLDTSVVLISEFDFPGLAMSIQRSDDGGANFDVVASVIANQLLFNPNDEDSVFAATDNGIHISTDYGLTFNPWVLAGEDCRSMTYDNNKLYVGTTDGKCFVIDNGTSANISGPWNTPVEIKSVLVEGGHLFVGLNGAEKDTIQELQGSIWQSDDFGGSWTNITTDMTSTNIYGNSTLASNGHEIFAATYGGGIFKSSGLNLSASITQESKDLISIYPNPGSKMIYINSDYLEIVHIYTHDGRLVMTSKQNSIDVSELNTGVYMLKILHDNQESTVRFIKE